MQGFDPVRSVCNAVKNSPWAAMSIAVHVALVAAVSVIYVHQQGKQREAPPMSLKTAQPRNEERVNPEAPEPVIDRKELPRMQDAEAPRVATEIFLPTVPTDARTESELERGEQTLDPTAIPNDLTKLPNGGAPGSTSIGVDGPGHRGFGPATSSSWKLGALGKFGSRFDEGKKRAARTGGENAAPAVRDGLAWLARHQDPDGHWDALGFMKHDREGAPCDGPGNGVNDVGITGLALLAFLGDGSTLRLGEHQKTVRLGVSWLQKQQAEDGLFGTTSSHEFIYNHAIATLAMCEAYGLSHYNPLQRSVQKAIDYIQTARNPYKVWRYFPRDGDNDTSVTGWMVLALKSAEEFKLTVDRDAFKAALLWFDQVTEPATGVAGYSKRGEGSSRKDGMQTRFPASRTECMTAVALLSRFFLGQDPKTTPVMTAAADTMLKKPPTWNAADGTIDMYYWYYGSFAMFQMGGNYWQQWNKRMLDAVVKTQRTDGNFKGSWDPVDPWGEDGGRVYSTAIMVLCLEVYYRYSRFLGR